MMSMLRTFFEIGRDQSMFDGLNIFQEKELCDKYMGQFPVISITMKSIDGDNYQEAIDALRAIIGTEAMRFQFLEESNILTENEKKRFRALINVNAKGKFTMEEDIILTSLKVLSDLLSKYYNQQVIILIDEYDVPLDKAFQNDYYDKMVRLIRNLFGNVLKTNDNLYFAVITGCLRISKESIFTGLNNFKVRTISDIDCAKYFGFTDHEVREMLRYYGVEDRFADVKEWYDGYHFGKVDVYCPWDVINQCDKMRVRIDSPMESHWENSSSNAIVRDIIEKATEATKAEIEALISGEFYHSMLLGLLKAEGSWITKSNAESGIEYTDITLTVPSVKIGCIIEVKYA